MTSKNWVLSAFIFHVLFCAFASASYAGDKEAETKTGKPAKKKSGPLTVNYSHREVLQRRFGDSEIMKYRAMVAEFKRVATERLVGQERMLGPLVDRLENYIATYGNRSGRPFAAHLVGVDGVGKTTVAELLEGAGFRVFRCDATVAMSIPVEVLEEDDSKPTILFVDGIDQSHLRGNGGQPQHSSDILGQLTALLNDGSLIDEGGATLGKASNLFVLTTVKLDPKIVADFRGQSAGGVIQSPEGIFHFSFDDMARFDQWLTQLPNWKVKILEYSLPRDVLKFFLSDILLMKPLSEEEYRAVIQREFERFLRSRNSKGSSVEEIRFDKSLVNFVLRQISSPGFGIGQLMATLDNWATTWARLGALAVD